MKNIILITLAGLLVYSCGKTTLSEPGEYKTSLTSYRELKSQLKKLDKVDFIEITKEGESVEGRDLLLAHLNRGDGPGKWRLFLFAQQHGNEPAGKEGLLYLLKAIANNPELLPADVELWVMPMVNPDGATADKRRNGNDFDLNRDHQILLQPEVQTLHRLQRKIMAHVSVDCHEFGRDSKDYNDQGWMEWPLIMMDCANSPIFGNDIYEAGVRWIEGARQTMAAKGINYTRYHVGSAPPEGELRFSTTEADDARNGLGAYGGLSFIIESGVRRNVETENADLPLRIHAYVELFKYIINNTQSSDGDLDIVRQTRLAGIPPFLPTNYFWGNKGFQIYNVPVIDTVTNEMIEIPSANFMQDLIVKKTVPTPGGYIIAAAKTTEFIKFLTRHELEFQVIDNNRTFTVEACKLTRLEKEWDELYSRYENRQIVERLAPAEKVFEAGSILVPLEGKTARRAALHLEPAMLYSLYQYPQFFSLIDSDSTMPVYRITGEGEG